MPRRLTLGRHLPDRDSATKETVAKPGLCFFPGDFRISGCWFLSPRPFPPVFNASEFPSHPVTLSAPYPLPMKSSSGLRVLNTASSPGAPCQISGVHLLIFWGVKVLGINVTREGTHATATVFEGDIIFFMEIVWEART